jgi:DMSO/TMAO reductase YedYZ heme-binding membrane subunit
VATAVLLMALAITPAQKIFRWSNLIDVRRIIGVAALVYTIFHILFYFPLRLWDFAFIATGTGSEIRQPLGYAIVGGLLVSQLLTLFTTPVVYIYMDRVAGWLDGRSISRSPDLTERQRVRS